MTLQTFSTNTIDAPAFFAVGLMDAPSETPVVDNVVKGMKIFRVGTFTDSLGRTNSWTQEDLEKMVRNFSALRGNPIVVDGDLSYDGPLPLIPLRLDHTTSIKDVIGYFANVYTDPTKPGFLFADVLFTEPDHLGKYKRGTYRNRSAEIGKYWDNDGTEYNPSVLGLAFVDLPAVERLNHNNGQGAGDQSPKPSANNQGGNVKTEAEWQAELDAALAAKTTAETALAAETTARTTAEAAVIAKEGELVSLRAGQPVPFNFSINGQTTQDFAAVQTYVATLETFRKETVESARTGYVDGLARAGKITNPTVEGFKTLALSMTEEQFGLWRAGYDATLGLNLFQVVPTHAGATPPPPPGTDVVADQISILEEIVASHRRARLPEEEIQKKPSYIQLQALRASAAQS